MAEWPLRFIAASNLGRHSQQPRGSYLKDRPKVSIRQLRTPTAGGTAEDSLFQRTNTGHRTPGPAAANWKGRNDRLPLCRHVVTRTPERGPNALAATWDFHDRLLYALRSSPTAGAGLDVTIGGTVVCGAGTFAVAAADCCPVCAATTCCQVSCSIRRIRPIA